MKKTNYKNIFTWFKHASNKLPNKIVITIFPYNKLYIHLGAFYPVYFYDYFWSSENGNIYTNI